ncbi:MAG: protein translocase subunit SecD [Candidatus Saganbacteria bacterium]|nr:protein translocase subunit SecD [Candidatus Saganbacteria bacterium]
MKNINQLRILLILGIVILSVFIFIKLPINLGLDLQGGSRIVFEGIPTIKVQQVNEDAMDGVVAVIRNRIDALGVSEPLVQRKGKTQVIVELPGIKDPDRALKVIGDTALLEFMESEWAPAGEGEISLEKVKQIYGPNARVGKVQDEQDGRIINERSIILKKTVLTGADLKTAMPGLDQYGNPVVDMEFNGEGAKAFGDVTTRNVGKPLAIVLDNKVISAPNVREPIPSGRAQISGNFSADDVHDMVIKLKAGALPVPVKMVEMRTVGPTLGKDSIDKSKFAGILGFILICAFMITYYRVPGALADVSLVIYVLILIALLSLVRATLTLPGIAGFLLSIGMAVDANILIFERLKEEVRTGKTLKAAIDASFNRALPSILDSNVTTVMAVFILLFVGTGTIKGFAITLILGIAASMFTAITLTRMLMYMLVDSGMIKEADSKLIYH